ncbi:DUF1987 domain-containing protein [Endothiovibrio diazotrophicus]
MEPITIAASERAPAVAFDFAANRFALRGESYPEDVNAFYGPLLERFNHHLGDCFDAEIRFDFELIYFNSSSAKVFMGLFDALDRAAGAGNRVLITWAYEEDDDHLEELGGEFAEELRHARFEARPIPVGDADR